MLLGSQPDVRVVGEAADGPGLGRLADELGPEVIVTELELPGPGGARVVPELCAARPHVKLLALTACDDPGALAGLLLAGAAGYVLKRSPASDLVRAVRAVVAGVTYRDLAATGAGPRAGRTEYLSGREAEVTKMIGLGHKNKEIATRLGLSVRTVETLKERALEKLGLEGQVQLVRYAVLKGWLDDTR